MSSLFANLLGRLPLAQRPGSFWLPPPSSTVSPGVDAVFYLILAIAAFFFLVVVGVMVFFVVRYRHRPGHTAQESPSHNTFLEVSWTVIPLIIVCVIFYQGFAIYMDMATPPDNAYEIKVLAQKWNFLFEYQGGEVVTDKLHVPKGEPVRLVMRSKDVIHSLSIPAFRVKKDCVPGMYTELWFQAKEAGEYDVFCTEFCGREHYNMLTKVIVYETRGEFDTWLAQEANILETKTPLEAGKILFGRRGCQQCHSVDGTAGTGPSLKGIFGSEHNFTDGSTVVVDRNYIRDSILNPRDKIRSGYKPQMPTYKGQLKDAEIDVIIEYIKSLE